MSMLPLVLIDHQIATRNYRAQLNDLEFSKETYYEGRGKSAKIIPKYALKTGIYACSSVP